MPVECDYTALEEHTYEEAKPAVKAFLVEQGANASQIQSAHHGESQPKADNSTPAGKAESRRCELMLDSPDPVGPYCQN